MLDLRFNTDNVMVETLNFSLDLEIQGFEGLIFYIYKPNLNKIEFDILDYRTVFISTIKNLHMNIYVICILNSLKGCLPKTSEC